MMKIAGKKHSPIVLIEHVGRKTGKTYQLPIMAQKYENGFMFALTYGTGVDWYKNVLASGRAKLTFNGTHYELSEPVAVGKKEGQEAFLPPKSNILRLIDIQDFFFMKAKES
jgi:deazaflavin-dependent oxidoreductase (nitroreductase family)